MLERELVEAVLADKALIALTGYDRVARARVLDTAEAQLTERACRIVRLRSFGDQPLDLQIAMNQVVGQSGGVADRVERFFDTIALPVAQERHIVLTIDNATRLTSDLLSYLALIGPTTVGQDLRLQVIFSGDPTMWDSLPRTGNLGADRMTTRIVINPAAMIEHPLPKLEAWPQPDRLPPLAPGLLPEPITRTEPYPPPTDGHEGLRHRLAQKERRRSRTGAFTAKVTKRIVTTIFILALLAGTAVLYANLPELRAAVRHLAAAKVATGPVESSTVLALVARGNWLMTSGDVPDARAVFKNAAMNGSASAVTGLAKSNDPRYLSEIGAHGVISDATLAISLYERAVAMGDQEAADRLVRLQAALEH